MPTAISGTAGVNKVAPNTVELNDFATVLFNGINSSDGQIKVPFYADGVWRELIIKWGTITSLAATSTPFTFSPAFPTACFKCIVCDNANSSANVQSIAIDSGTLTAAGGTVWTTVAGGFGNAHYIAVGI